MTQPNLRTWIEVDTRAVRHNYQVFRRLIGKKVQLAAVVKSNSYGHNLLEYSKLLTGLGADILAVDSMTEALALRAQKISSPILVLGYTLPEFFLKAAQKKITLSLSSDNQIDLVAKFIKTSRTALHFHLKVDTGMHRQGWQLKDFSGALAKLKKMGPKIKIDGIYSHLAAPAENKFDQETKRQIKTFHQAVTLAEQHGFSGLTRHLAATGGTLYWPEAHFDLVRVGIGLYGYLPGGDKKTSLKLKPALTWKTIVSEIKTVPKGDSVGYSFSEKLKQDSLLAILPVGYWHGYPRLLSGQSEVLVAGQRAKIVGRVSMDMLIVDVTKIKNCRAGTEVILLGESLTPEELASQSQTSHYEIITRLNPLIKKIYR
jgi:alanine racemase